MPTDTPTWEDTQEVPTWEETTPDLSTVKLDPYQKAYQESGLQSPMEVGNADFTMATSEKWGAIPALAEAAVSGVGNLSRALVSDIVTGDSKNPIPNTKALFKGEELPVDETNRILSKSNPTVATIGKLGQSGAAMIPMTAMGALPAWANRIIAGGFAADMASKAPKLYTELKSELGKSKDEQDPDKVTSLISDAIQTGIFVPLAAYGALHPTAKAKLSRNLADQIRKSEFTPKEPFNEIHNAPAIVEPIKVSEEIANEKANLENKPGVGSIEEQAAPSPAVLPAEPIQGNKSGEVAKGEANPLPVDYKLIKSFDDKKAKGETPTQKEVDEKAKEVANKSAAGFSPEAWAKELGVDSPTEPKIVGMGGAIPEEFARGQGSPTAMKYKLIDQERQKRGLEPLVKSESVSDQATMDKAMAEIDKDPSLPDKLVAELNSKPRTIEDWENHVLLLRKIDLRDAYEKSAREAAQAYDDAKEFPDRSADVIKANLETARLSDQLTELEKASRVSGSARGRALRSLQVMANEDYSLASLETQRRAVKGGAPLTESERADLKKVADDYQKSNQELQAHLKEKDSKIAEMEVKAALDKLAAEKQSQYSPYIIKVAEKLVAGLDKRADAARQRIKERGFRFSSGIDPTLLLDVAEIGASHIAKTGLDLAKWSVKMVEEFGEGIKPHLAGIFKSSQDIVENLKAKEPVKRIITKQTLDDQIKTTKEKAGEKISRGDRNQIAPQIQKLARLFIEKGVKGRDELIDAIHSIILDIDPKFTRRETMDAISGYGDFRQLSKDEVSVKLRGLKGEMQQVAKLQDMADGIPPSKTGMERRTPTDEERRLIKAVNDAKIKFQVPITDPATQLKSALDTKKTQLENQVKDLEERLSKGDFGKRPRRDLVLDRRAQELQANRDRVAKKFKSEQRKFQLANRTNTEKFFDFISNARRFSVLSGVHVLGKLAAYSATKIPTMAVTEGIGNVLSKLPYVKEVSAKSPSEGALQIRDLSKAVAKGLTQGFLDAGKTATTGSSDLKSAFSTRLEGSREWYNFFQMVHEVIKSPLRRTAFELSLAKRMEHAANNGADITDPMVQLALAKDAYLDSDRALLLESNKLASGIRGVFKQFEQPNKATGEPSLHGKIAATAGRVEFPILSVPLNYAKQTITSAFGLVSGSYKLRAAFSRGIENLKPEEADAIMRHLKYGTVGSAMLLYGFIDGYNNGANGTFGGYYQPGEKRKEEQAGVGGIKIGDTKISGLFLHNPVLAVAQLGHTMGAIMRLKMNKGSSPTTALTVAGLVGMADLVNESPIGRSTELLSQASDYRSADYALGEHVKGLVVPQLVNEVSQWTDKDANGKLIKRHPTNIVQHVELAIPGLRQKVPKKK